MSELTSAAAILGTALDVAKPIVETGCTLLENLLGEPAKVAGGMLADQVYWWQWRNRIRILHRARQLLDERGVEAKVLPPGFLVPLLEECGNVDEPSLQELWAELLANAVSDESLRQPRFCKVLTELSTDEARLLTSMLREPPDFYAERCEESDQGQLILHEGIDFRGDRAASYRSADQICVYVEHFILLGVCAWTLAAERVDLPTKEHNGLVQFETISRTKRVYRIQLTDFGAAFLEALGIRMPAGQSAQSGPAAVDRLA